MAMNSEGGALVVFGLLFSKQPFIIFINTLWVDLERAAARLSSPILKCNFGSPAREPEKSRLVPTIGVEWATARLAQTSRARVGSAQLGSARLANLEMQFWLASSWARKIPARSKSTTNLLAPFSNQREKTQHFQKLQDLQLLKRPPVLKQSLIKFSSLHL